MNNIDKMLGNIMSKSKTTKLKTNNNVLGNFGLKQFGGRNDLDFDGVPNRKDCQPRNTMRQDALSNEVNRQMKARLKKSDVWHIGIIQGRFEEYSYEVTTDTPKGYIKRRGHRGKWITPTLFDNGEDMVIAFAKNKSTAYNMAKKQWQKLLEY